MRLRILAASAALAAIVFPARADETPAAAPQTPDIAGLQARLEQTVEKAQMSYFDGEEGALKSIIADPAFSQLSDREQYLSYLILGGVEVHAHDPQDAYPNLVKSTSFASADGQAWEYRLIAAYEIKNFDDSIHCLTLLAQQWPDKLADINDGAITDLGNRAAEMSAQSAIALLAPMHEMDWQPHDTFQKPDGLWFRLAVAYAEVGRTGDASRVLAGVDDVHALIQVKSDKRFDAIVALNPSHFDIAAELKTIIDAARAKSAAAPDKLEGINFLADDLLRANRAWEALDLLDQAIARIKSAGAASFADYDTKYNWTLDTRSRALFALGRDEGGFKALSEGASLSEDNATNVSQPINLADELNAHSRPQDALNAVEHVTPDNTSPYGAMALAEAKVCAFSQMADPADLAVQMKYITAHTDDGRGVALKAFICANDFDAAAKLIIAALQDPMKRGDMLDDLQDYAHPIGETSWEKEYMRKFEAVRARADVAAAINAVGRIGSYPILPS